MAENVLFIAAHPDDETLGCGGTILKHKAQGDAVYWLIITKAYAEDGFNPQVINDRENEIRKVEELYGFDGVFRLNLHTTLLDTYPLREIVSAIGEVVHKVKASILFVPHRYDAHSDHRVTFDASWSCSKSFRYPSVQEVYTYETLSETEFAPPKTNAAFVPNTFYDISGYLEKKTHILEQYTSEVAPHPFPRSSQNSIALATLRGAQIGVESAEAFMCLKRIVKK